jgi:hypothetical protein
MINPFASILFEITTAGLIGIFFVLIDFKMDSILLPRPEIRIPRFSN